MKALKKITIVMIFISMVMKTVSYQIILNSDVAVFIYYRIVFISMVMTAVSIRIIFITIGIILKTILFSGIVGSFPLKRDG
ncbi:MAG: hypothetical protein LBH90_04230 [Tannerella sp.]|jgi:hypothetical protein|nr:hypothetical protein [Tannerella sp.]